MNKIILMGRLTADPQMVRSNTAPYCKFTIAVNRKSGDKTDFINCIAWRKTAEFICKFFSKGKMIAVEGSLQINQYTDKEGNRRTFSDVSVDSAHFCGDRSHTTDSNTDSNTSSTVDSGNLNIEYDDDLPFE